MWSSFNIAKSDRPLKWFVQQIHDLRDPQALGRWQSALEIGPAHLDPDAADEATIRSAIATRTRSIKDALKAFIRGEHLLEHEKPVFDVSGAWSMRHESHGEPPSDLVAQLSQSGDLVYGSYDGGGRIEGRLYGRDFDGGWSDESGMGWLWGRFDEDGKTFDGQWKLKRQRRPACKWTGQRRAE